MFKSMFDLSNVNISKKSIAVVSFIVTAISLALWILTNELINFFGADSEKFFNLISKPASGVFWLSLIVFIIFGLLSALGRD